MRSTTGNSDVLVFLSELEVLIVEVDEKSCVIKSHNDCNKFLGTEINTSNG